MENKLKIDNNTVVHCPTEELANKVLAIADKLGYKWFSGGSFLNKNNWCLFEEETCYNLKKGMLAAVYTYKKDNHNIISAEDFLKLHEEKEKPILYYIRGVEDKGKEVVKMLEEKGGKSRFPFRGNGYNEIYYINGDGVILAEDCDGKIGKLITTYGTELFLTEKPKEYEFKPFEKVLARGGKNDYWRCDFYSHYTKINEYPHFCTSGINYTFCIPYENNEHLLGTTNNK